ncbi:hypothetical protein [Amycolatopsis sp. H20-H5]|uniref:hypothetical protein n=1 Tax=Amycolatopsis sp. H20-H5 TaxID=3046309 RepID=UPI002DBBE647|nr:hypothetical protein [Amycolatopsis sp. H20-H5]MEC3974186.1 hypothetical protein [Amycolatopsis sp. H20-H5]
MLILNPGTAPNRTSIADLSLVEDGTADMISFGGLFVANPDLPRWLELGGPFAEPDSSKFYGGGDSGYVDYPPLPT